MRYTKTLQNKSQLHKDLCVAAVHLIVEINRIVGSGYRSIQEAAPEPSDARDAGLDPGLDPDLDPGLGPICLLLRLKPSSLGSVASPLARLTNTVGSWVEAISNLSSAALLFAREEVDFLLVLGWGEGRGNPGKALCEDEEASPAAAEDEEPSLANATGISSKDSAESEWYSAGGAAAWMGPEARARGGREALRGKAGKGSR